MLVPCIPARELVLNGTDEAAAAASDLSAWPVFLQQPLLKVQLPRMSIDREIAHSFYFIGRSPKFLRGGPRRWPPVADLAW